MHPNSRARALWAVASALLLLQQMGALPALPCEVKRQGFGFVTAGSPIYCQGAPVDLLPEAKPPPGAADRDGDGMGDEWEINWSAQIKVELQTLGDLDCDGLANVDEFRWGLIPIYDSPPCGGGTVVWPNGKDSDSDGLLDGPEVGYWDNPGNNLPTSNGWAPYDPDRELDTDDDGAPNVWDPDSDWDGLRDGEEANTYGTHPGIPDTDADGINEGDEKSRWGLGGRGPDAWRTDYDGDGSPNNLLDPDSENDGLLDGEEFGQYRTNPASPDSDNDALDDWREVRMYRSSPVQWDSDGDGLPDGWEVWYGFDPNVKDSHLDFDDDGYNPTGLPSDNDPWTNLEEYQYKLPSGWNVPANGVWWNGTIPGNRDTDGDGVLDGVEAHFGSDATNGSSTDPRGRDANGNPHRFIRSTDPTNEDLPEEEMDPVNVQYLRQNRRDAEGTVSGTAEVADQLVAAAIAGNVTQALNIVYDATPIGPPLRDTTALVEVAEDAVVNLVKCATDTPSALANGPSATTENVTGCVTESLLPVVDTALDRTLSDVPILGDVTANLRQQVLPAAVGTVRAAAGALDTATRPFLADPVGSVTQAVLSVPEYVQNPESLNQRVNWSQAAAQLSVAKLLKPSGRHPQFLYDAITRNGLGAYWPLIAAANQEVAKASGGNADAVAVADSLVFNLYTNRSGAENVTGVPVGQRTCVQLDGSGSTRDANGCDLYASLTVRVEASDELGGGRRVVPTLRLETAVSGARFQLEALGYLQIANSPYIVVLGYNTSSNGTAPGQPRVWEGTLIDYDARESAERSFSFVTRFEDARSAIPMHVVAGAFRVNTSAPGKPVAPGNETVVQAYSDSMPSRLAIDARKSNAPDGGSRTALTVDISAATSLDLGYSDAVIARKTEWVVGAVALPAGETRLSFTAKSTESVSWTWNSVGATSSLWGRYREEANGAVSAMAEVSGNALPPSIVIQSDASRHIHEMNASGVVGNLSFLLATGTTACPALNQSTQLNVLAARGTAWNCMTGRADGYALLRAESTSQRTHATGSRASGDTRATTVLIQDGNELFLALPSSPRSWTASLQVSLTGAREIAWNATSPLANLTFEATLGGNAELLRARLTNVPTGLRAVLDPALDQEVLEASDFVGSLELVHTTTGLAPTLPATTDYVRTRMVDAGQFPTLESAWKVSEARALEARIAPSRAFEVEGDFRVARPLAIGFHDASHALQLDASPLAGSFRFALEERADLGTFAFDQTVSQSVSAVKLAGRMPGGLVHVELANAPAQLRFDADLTSQLVKVEASGAIGRLDARYAAGAAYPTLAGDNAVVVSTGAGAPRGFHANLSSLTGLVASATANTVDIETAFSSAVGFTARFEDAKRAMALRLDPAPSEARLVHNAGSFAWSAQGVTDITYGFKGRDAGNHFVANVTDAPGVLNVNWTTAGAGVFETSLFHSGASTLSAIRAEEYRPGTGGTSGSGWWLNATGPPSTVRARLVPSRGQATVEAAASDGSPWSVASFETGFTESSAQLRTIPATVMGDAVLLSSTGNSASSAVRLTNLHALEARLQASLEQESTPLLVFSRASGGQGLFLRSDVASLSSTTEVQVLGGPAALNLSVLTLPGVEGFEASSSASADFGGLRIRLSGGNRTLRVETGSTTPASFAASWKAGEPLNVSASRATNLVLQYSDSSANAPWRNDSVDFLVIDAPEAGVDLARLGARLTGVRNVLVDPAAGRFRLDGDVAVLPATIDLRDEKGRLVVDLSERPANLEVASNAAERRATINSTGAVGTLTLFEQPVVQEAPRMFLQLDGAPAGVTRVSQDVPTGAFIFDSAAPVARVVVIADNGHTPLFAAAEEGVFVQRLEGGDALRVNLSGTRAATALPPTLNAGPSLIIERAQTALLAPARVRLAFPGITALAELDPLGASTTRIEWPISNAADATLNASGLAGGRARLAFDAGQSWIQAETRGLAPQWTFMLASDGRINHSAGSTASSLAANGSWGRTAFDLTATGAPTTLVLAPEDGMARGNVEGSGFVDRLTLALATASSGRIAKVPRVPITNRDVFAVDTTPSVGALTLDVPNLKAASWELPPESESGSVRFALDRSAPSTRSALVQGVHAMHQTRFDFAQGLPTVLNVSLNRTPANWTFQGGVGSKSFALFHQVDDGDAMKIIATSPAASLGIAVDPKAEKSLDYTSSGNASRVFVETRWNQGYLRADFSSGVPASARVNSGGTFLRSGQVATLGTGTIGHATVLLVPNAGTTANRLYTYNEHLAVETNGKAPYVSLRARNLQNASWSLPAAGTDGPVLASFQRASTLALPVQVVLSGPGDDMTAKVTGSPPTLSLQVQPSTNVPGATSVQPFILNYSSLGGPTGRIDVTHFHAKTGQSASAYLTNVPASARLEATGAEPAKIILTASSPPGSAGIRTTDAGTLLKMDVNQPTSMLETSVVRGDCGLSEPFRGHVSTLGTGATGSVRVFVGDEGYVPNLPAGAKRLDARCGGGEAHVGLQFAKLDEARWDTTPCASTYRIPAFLQEASLYVENEKGLFDVRAYLQSSGFGFVGLDFTNGNGLYLNASDALGAVAGDTTLPLCMEFITPVKWIRASGTGVPPGLQININDLPASDGNVYDGILVQNLNDAVTSVLHVDAGLDPVARRGVHEAELEFRSSFHEIEVYLDDNGVKKIPREITSDGSMANVVDGFDYYTRYRDLKSFIGYANRTCGVGSYDVRYDRIPGTPPRKMYDLLDFGDGCDKNLLDFDSMPQHVRYQLDAKHGLLKSTFTILESTDPIHLMSLRAKTTCENSEKCPPFGEDSTKFVTGISPNLYWNLRLEDIPAGPVVFHVYLASSFLDFPLAGVVQIDPTVGRIGRVDLGISGEGPNSYLSLGYSNAKMLVEWDLDGQTRFPNVPVYYFGHTYDGYVWGSARIRHGDAGFGIGGEFLLREFQIRPEFKLDLVPFSPGVTGTLCPRVIGVEALAFGQWWGIGLPLDIVATGCP